MSWLDGMTGDELSVTRVPPEIADRQPGLHRDTGERRRDDDGPPPPLSVSKTLGIALAAITLVSLIFTAGYNWRSVAIVEANQENFVRKDVQKEQLENVSSKLAEISRQLEEMRGELKAQRRKD